MCSFLTAKGMGRWGEGDNNPEKKFFRDEFTPNRKGVGKRKREAEVY